MSGLALFAALGVLAVAAIPVCATVWASTMRFRATGRLAATSPSLFWHSKAAVRLCLGLSCASALACASALWLSRQNSVAAFDVAQPMPWGVLWVYAFGLLLEWRLVGIRNAGRRALTGLLLAVVGVLFLGIGLGAWTGTVASTELACPVNIQAKDLNAWWIRSMAALGLVLVPLAGIALGLNRVEHPPLSAAPAGVAVAVWLEPALPALGWLPTTGTAGAALAVLLIVALVVLALTCARGLRATLGGLFACFALSVGGCIFLGIQMEGQFG